MERPVRVSNSDRFPSEGYKEREMKKLVLLLALMCLLSVFQSVFAGTNPAAKENLIYDGTNQFLVTEGVPDEGQKYYYRHPNGSWVTEVPAGHFPGVYTVEWLLVAGDIEPDPERPGTKLSVTIKEYNPPQPANWLVYNGTQQFLVNPDTGKALGEDLYYYRNRYNGEWTRDVPEATEPGSYTVEYYLANPANPPAQSIVGTKITAVIRQSSSPDVPVPPSPTGNPDDPQPSYNLKANGTEQNLIIPGKKDTGGMTYYYRLISFSNASSALKSVPSMEWSTEIPTGLEPGIYVVEYKLASAMPTAEDEGEKLTIVIAASDGTYPDPGYDPQPQPQPGPSDTNVPIYYIGDGTTLFGSSNTLPATGFPTRIHVPLSVKPANINYESLSMRIQIPTINVDVELTGVPEIDGTWAVEWLADQAGLLSGSAMPGEGHAMIAAHNHLNTMEIGPFAMLFSLEENDRIFVNTADDGLQIYTVYANELLEPDDMQKMASIAQSEENSIILVTCENEMIEGGYMNRRAVFAKPQ